MRTLVAIALFLAAAGSAEAQTRAFPGAVGGGSQTLVPNASIQPTICSVNDMGDGAGDATTRTFRYCAEGAGSVGFNLVVFFEAPGCVFTVGGAGLGAIEITNDSTVVLGQTCQAGAIHVRTYSHAINFGSPAWAVKDASHIILADAYGWDQDCVSGSGCTGGDQKQFRFGVDDHGIMIRFAVHGNSNDDVMSVCAPNEVPSGCQDLTMYSVLIGPVKKSPDVGGEGQCNPTGNNAERLSVVRVFCAQAGHRALILNCLDCEIDNFAVTGQGGRSMETYYATRVAIRGSVWRNMWPRSGGRHSEIFRYRENITGVGPALAGDVKVYFSSTNVADTLLPTGDSLANFQVTGASFVNHVYNEGSRCEGGSTFLMNGCTWSSQTADTSHVLSRTKTFVDLPNQPPVISAQTFWDDVTLNHQIGPHVLVACDGTVSSTDNLRPFTKTHLTRQRYGRIPNNENDWPTSMAAWAVGGDAWPDTTSVGRPSCADTSPANGIPDALEARVGGLLDDPDGDGYENWREIYLSHTDPLVATADDGTEGGGSAPSPALGGTLFAYVDQLFADTAFQGGVDGSGDPTTEVINWNRTLSARGERCGGFSVQGYRQILFTYDTIQGATALDSMALNDTLAAWNLPGRCASIDAVKGRTIPSAFFAQDDFGLLIASALPHDRGPPHRRRSVRERGAFA